MDMDKSGGQWNVVANWGDENGLPHFMPYYADMNDPFPFLFVDVADVRVDELFVHRGRLCDEVSNDRIDAWNPLDDDLESDVPCMVYPLTNNWKVVALENWN